MNSAFEQQLALGHEGERIVDAVLRERGWGVIQSYGFLGDGDNKAPKLNYQERSFVLPDLDVAKSGGRLWVEVKTFWHAPRNHTHRCDVHGFSRRLYDQYLEVEQRTGAPVYVFVLEVKTGDLLCAPLLALKQLSCLCRRCKEGRPGSRCDVYFDRAEFRLVENVTARADFRFLQATWPTRGAA